MIDASPPSQLAEAGAGATVTLSLGGRSTPLFDAARGHRRGARRRRRSRSTRRTCPGALQHGPLRRLRGRAGHAARHRVRRCRRASTRRRTATSASSRSDHQMVVMKTASNFQYMTPVTSEVIRVATPGPTQSDLAGSAVGARAASDLPARRADSDLAAAADTMNSDPVLRREPVRARPTPGGHRRRRQLQRPTRRHAGAADVRQGRGRAAVGRRRQRVPRLRRRAWDR